MRGSQLQDPRATPVRRAASILFVVALAATALLFSGGPATAAAKTVDTQLSLSGLADEDNPLGGSMIGIHPGDAVRIKTSTVPTAGLNKLGLGNLVGDLLSGVLGVQSTADFSKFPGGNANTVIKKGQSVSFRFSKVGTYNFTWTMQKLTVLGGLQNIDLDGNQLKRAGVKLNAQNEYVGKIVVAKNPPKGGLQIQTPKVSVQPEAGPVKGPKVTIPGAQTPRVETPNLPKFQVPQIPGGGSGSGSGSGGSGGGASSSANTGPSYQAPGLSVPDRVVPNGDSGGTNGGGGAGTLVGNQGGTGLYYGGYPGTSGSGNGVRTSPDGSGGSDTGSGSGSSAQGAGPDSVELASDAESGQPSSQLPVILAILAIVALALVAGTYARLFLLKKQL